MPWAKARAEAVKATGNVIIAADEDTSRASATSDTSLGIKLLWSTITKITKTVNTSKDVKEAKRGQKVPRVMANRKVANHFNLGPKEKASLGQTIRMKGQRGECPGTS